VLIINFSTVRAIFETFMIGRKVLKREENYYFFHVEVERSIKIVMVKTHRTNTFYVAEFRYSYV